MHRNLPLVHWQAIESGMTSPGIPDTNGCYRGCEFWIECKKTDSNNPGLIPEQVGWIARRSSEGGRVFVLVWLQAGSISDLILVPGSEVRILSNYGINQAVIAGRWTGGEKKWNWDEVLQRLTGRT